jgi:penicillin-binding protein 1B
MGTSKRAEGKTPSRHRFRLVGFVLLLVVAAALLGLWHLSREIEDRFAGRRWSIPSKVFSDTTLLYSGQTFPRRRLEAKLARLGYRPVTHPPERHGEIRSAGSRLDIFLRDFLTPQRSGRGFPARLTFRQDRIESITRLDTGAPLPLLEIEPEELMLFFGKKREDRRLVSLQAVPRQLVDAILAAEDARFFQHPGMDLRGILRALLRNIRHGALREGGSTITQQLAKNYFLTPEKTLSRKFKELLIALLMEAQYSKDEILEIYLNEIYLGQKGSVSVNGVGEAAFFYFGKPVPELSLSEAATLAGLIKAPNLYSPFADRERSRQRRNRVLESMLAQGRVSRQAFTAALAEPIRTVKPETYARQAPYFMDYLSQQLHSLYSPEALSTLGLSIYTSLDPEVQRAAEEALLRGLANLEKANPALRRPDSDRRLQGAVVVLHPRTGTILALVGGREYGGSQFNRITQARRQPGSAFKPFVFLAALDEFTPATLLSNEERAYRVGKTEWRPENYAPVPEPQMSMRMALAKSVNRAAADLTMRIGVDRIIAAASPFGFSIPLPPYPSLGLGAGEVIPLELARAYCAFAADGLLPHPLSLKEVVDEKGVVLQRKQLSLGKATSPEKAFLITSMLRSVTQRGTAGALRDMGISFPVAGKTGTTNDFRDAWFVGYTPDILALVWVGFDDGAPIMASGSAAALPIFADLMKAIPQHLSGEWFQAPPGVVTLTICPDSGQLAVPGRCPTPEEEVFLAENRPDEPCPRHPPSGWDRGIEPLRNILRGLKNLFE